MRQDPDVVLIGEIRDRETAEIAIQASLTGHLVLSTLHTNDAPSAVTRLIDIGVASYKIATAVKGVLAQRLVRRVVRRVSRDAARMRRVRRLGLSRPAGARGGADRVARVRATRRGRRIDGAHRRGGARATACGRCGSRASRTPRKAERRSTRCCAWRRPTTSRASCPSRRCVVAPRPRGRARPFDGDAFRLREDLDQSPRARSRAAGVAFRPWHSGSRHRRRVRDSSAGDRLARARAAARDRTRAARGVGDRARPHRAGRRAGGRRGARGARGDRARGRAPVQRARAAVLSAQAARRPARDRVRRVRRRAGATSSSAASTSAPSGSAWTRRSTRFGFPPSARRCARSSSCSPTATPGAVDDVMRVL